MNAIVMNPLTSNRKAFSQLVLFLDVALENVNGCMGFN